MREVPVALVLVAGLGVIAAGRRRMRTTDERAMQPTGLRAKATRQLNAGAATLAFSVLADSTLEHYRGGFYNRAMYIAPVVSVLTIGAGLSAARHPERGGHARAAVYGAAMISGAIGLGFHVGNISRREGGWSWLNAFYGAPVAAPLAISMAGLLGLAASAVATNAGASAVGRGGAEPQATLFGQPASAALGALSALGLLGTAAESGLLHFRGAFQNPYMYLPVTVPPVAAAALVAAVLTGSSRPRGLARILLRATVALGFAGVGFHVYGVHRNMGGWRNWSQNIQNGPPIPAPPSFTGLALAGLAALDLMVDRATDERGPEAVART